MFGFFERELKGDDERERERERSATKNLLTLVGEAATLYLHVEYEPFLRQRNIRSFPLLF